MDLPLTAPNILLWMLVVGVFGFVAMGVDKELARSNWGERISERTLWLVSLAGGSFGVVLGALVFHHKTSKAGFWPPVLLALCLWSLLLALVHLGRLPLGPDQAENPLRRRRMEAPPLKRREALLACLVIISVALAVVSVSEYSEIQAAGSGMVLASDKGVEVVYNLQGIAIAISCCPNVVSSFVVGGYLFQDSSVSPPPPLTVNGTTTSFKSGVALVMSVSPLSDDSKTQQLEFA